MMGYKVKIDTNGYDPTHLSHILKNNLADYIAMDIKNSQENYAKTAGISNLDLTRIKLSSQVRFWKQPLKALQILSSTFPVISA